MSSKEQPKPSTFRCRELCALLGVLLVGAALGYALIFGRGEDAGLYAFAAFFAAVTLIVFGYAGGMILDRLAERYPILTKARHSTIAFIILPPLLVVGGILVWNRREPIMEFTDQRAQRAMEAVEEFVTGEDASSTPDSRRRVAGVED